MGCVVSVLESIDSERHATLYITSMFTTWSIAYDSISASVFSEKDPILQQRHQQPKRCCGKLECCMSTVRRNNVV